VIMLSQEESRRMGHNFVGTEQLLLGVIGQRHGVGARALKKMKVTIRKTRKEIELYIGRGRGFVASEIPFTPRAKRALEMAVQESKDLGQNFVGTEHLLLALLAESEGIALRTLRKLDVDIDKLRSIIFALIGENQEGIIRPLTQVEKLLVERSRRPSITPTLDQYSENLTKEAVEGNLDPVIGRETEIDDVIAVLSRRTKNNPVLIGEPGVGKTAIAEGLAQLIVSEQVPEFLQGSFLTSLQIGSVLAGTKYRGEFEERLKRIIEEVQNDLSVILVIDEIHTIIGAGAAEGAVDAANILKPALARGRFRCIGATTSDEYRKHIERDPALERRFQPIQVPEPDIETAITILKGLRSKLEQHHSLTYTDKAIEQAVILSSKYIADRYLPDKAIDVLDEAGARVRLKNRKLPLGVKKLLQELHETIKDKQQFMVDHDFETAKQLLEHELEVRSHIRIMKQSLLTLAKKEQNSEPVADNAFENIDKVTEQDVAEVVSKMSGIPVAKLTTLESERLLHMEETIHENLIGQHHAVTAVSKAVRRSRSDLGDPNRPASFIFAGPTGVGKTELAKTVSEFLFGKETDMIRLDMSEYMEKHTVAKLIGSPPGYVGYNEGGLLTEAVRSKPYSLVLFDEVEKAHPDVFNLLLQILDDGRLSDSKGRVINFKQTIIILTTNLGSKIIERESGIASKSENKDKDKGFSIAPDVITGWKPKPEPEKDPELVKRVNKLVNDELKNFFRPEFLNRIDEIVVFNHLTKTDIWEISELMIKGIQERLEEKDLHLIVEPSAQAFLADEGYDPIYGARPLRRAMMRHLEDGLAEACLSQTLYTDTRIIVRRKKVEGSLVNYADELEIIVDFSQVDPKLLEYTKDQEAKAEEKKKTNEQSKEVNNIKNIEEKKDKKEKKDKDDKDDVNNKKKKKPGLF